MSENVFDERRLSFGVILAGIIVLGAFAFVASGAGSTLPLSFTFIIKSPAKNTYQAFITGGSTTTPFASESNFSRLMNVDILGSSACLNGCSMTINPAVYNLTQRILVGVPAVTIAGSIASVIQSQNVTFTGAFRPMIEATNTGLTISGLKLEDANRVRSNGVTGDGIDIDASSSNVLIQSVTIQNASSSGITVQGSNVIVTTSTITRFLIPKVINGGNFGINIGGTASGVRLFLNTISEFNGTDVSGIQMSNGASQISITSNNLFHNSFGVSSTCGRFLTVNGNTIHDNYAGGVLLTTLGIGGPFPCGPSTIAENIVTNNGQEINTDGQCGNLHCSGFELRAPKAGWDTVSLTGNVIRDTQAIHTQFYGIHIFPTLATNYSNLTITGNSLGTTASGITIFLAVSPQASWTISDNPGFNPQPIRGPLTAGASPFTYANNDGYREQIYIVASGGMTSLVCRGLVLPTSAQTVTMILNSVDICVFTWSATAPTYDVLPT
jgi:Right handed beta helix region